MAKVTKAAELLELLRTEVKFDGLVITNGEEINEKIEALYPHDLKQNQVDDLDKFRSNLFEAIGTVSSERIAEVAKEDDDLNAAEIQHSLGTVRFSTAWSKPTTEKPTEKEMSASIAFGMAVQTPTALRKAVPNAFAKTLLEDIGAEDGDEEEKDEKVA